MRVLPLALAAAIFSGLTAILIYLSGLSSYGGGARVSDADLAALTTLQGGFSKCVDANGLGLQAVAGDDYCRVVIRYPSDTVSKWDVNGLGLQAVAGDDYCCVVIRYPSDTVSKWKDPKTGESEGLSFEFNLCEVVASWEQVLNSTTILTKEYIDALPNGWEEYAWRRINKGILLNKCRNRTLCVEKISLVLPETSPYILSNLVDVLLLGTQRIFLKLNLGMRLILMMLSLEKMVHPSRTTQNMLVERVHSTFLIEDLQRHQIKSQFISRHSYLSRFI